MFLFQPQATPWQTQYGTGLGARPAALLLVGSSSTYVGQKRGVVSFSLSGLHQASCIIDHLLRSRVAAQGDEMYMFWDSNAQHSPLYLEKRLYYLVWKVEGKFDQKFLCDFVPISCARHAHDPGELEFEHRTTTPVGFGPCP